MSEESTPPPWQSVLSRAWSRRCPRCGTGDLFAKRFRLAESADLDVAIAEVEAVGG